MSRENIEYKNRKEADLSTTIIHLPQDPEIVEKLKRKHREYTERFECERRSNLYAMPQLLRSWYAVKIIETLLNQGSVDTWKLSQEIAAAHGGGILRLDYFENYCGVINDYVNTGGANSRGGTGLQ